MTDQTEKYFRTVLVVEVLTATQAWNGDLHGLSEECMAGDASGHIKLRVVEEVSPGEMAELLTAQGSDPSFLLGDEGRAETGHSDDTDQGSPPLRRP